MFQFDTEYKNVHANLGAALEWTSGLLDASESALKLNLEAAEELWQATLGQWQFAATSVDTSNPMAVAPSLVSRSLEGSTQLLRAYIATAVKLQAGLSEIAQSQMPGIARSLGGMWLAPWSGFGLPFAEMARRAAPPSEYRAKKAA